MKQPSLEEVKEYFKNAEKVKSCYGNTFKYKGVQEGYCNNTFMHKGKAHHTLWSPEKGYAEILTYKEKTFSITESQIKELCAPSFRDNQERLKEMFAEAFESEVKLEVGKWYRAGHYLICLKEIDGKYASVYGFENKKWYESNSGFAIIGGHFKLKEATEQEVFEALKNEAVKRGFVQNAYYKNLGGEIKQCGLLKYSKLWSGLHSLTRDGMIFKHGKWAEIIPTITLSEAEQELGKKIIV